MAARNDKETEVTIEEFNEIINNSYKLVVVDFFAEWCMPCLMLAPVIEELAEKMPEIKFVKLNTDENRKLSSKYGISSIPCLIIFKNGKEIDRMIGAQSGEAIEKKIKKYLK